MPIDRFPVEATINVDFSSDPASVRNSVTSEAAGVSSTIQSLRGQSEALQQTASQLIQDVYSFTPTEIPEVTFGVETDPYRPFRQGVEPDLPDGLFRLGSLSYLELGDLPQLSLQEFTRSTLSAPGAAPIEFPVFRGIPSVGAAPTAPPDIELNISAPPGLDLDLQELPDPGDAPVFAGTIDVGEFEFADIEPFPACDIQPPDLGALDAFEHVVGNKFSRSEYARKVLPVAVQASEALVNGNFVIDLDALEAGTHDNADRAAAKYDRRVSSIWSRRGFQQNENLRDHVDRVRARVQFESRLEYDAAVERWRMAILPVALQLATEAHAGMVEVLGELYDLDFAFLEAEHTALRSLYSLAAARLNLHIQQVEQQVTAYRGLVAQVRARAELYRAAAGRAEATGRINQSISRGYAAGQRARESEGDVFIADVEANQSILSAFEAQIRAMEAEVRALRARVVAYDGEVSEWEGQFNSARAAYREVRAQNQAVVAQNRARTARMTAESTAAASVADEAAASATEASALAAFLRGEIAQREGEYVRTNFENTAAALLYGSEVTDFRSDAALFGAQIANDIQNNDNAARVNTSVASTFREIANNAVRAAELTQSNRFQLATLFENLYEAAGRADAARVTGQLSKFRASYGLQASGDLSYDSDISRSVAYADSVSNDQSNTRRTTYTELEE